MELLIGCGSRREKLIALDGKHEWKELITLDVNPGHKPNVLHNLEDIPLPFEDNTFDEIHAYDVLEHLGAQGDYCFFFSQWNDFYRILKPNGTFHAVSPDVSSRWAFGDPGHKRILQPENLLFLHQPSYTEQVGKTAMTDYRFIYTGDFDTEYSNVEKDRQFAFIVKAVKPSRISR